MLSDPAFKAPLNFFYTARCIALLVSLFLSPDLSAASFACNAEEQGGGHSHFYLDRDTALSACPGSSGDGCRYTDAVSSSRPLPDHRYFYCKFSGVNDNKTIFFAYPLTPCPNGVPDINTGACPPDEPPPEFAPWNGSGTPPASVSGITAAVGSVLAVREPFTIKNNGADGATFAEVYLSTDTTWDDNDVLLGTSASVDVESGQTVVAAFSYGVIPESTPAGDYSLLWIVNPNEYKPYINDGTEGNDEEVLDNNMEHSSITILSADKPEECPANCPEQVGNPIDVATGRKKENITDYQGAGPFPLAFTRRYNSGLGEPWQFSYTSHLRIEQDRIGVVLDSGQGYEFTMVAGVGTPDPDVPGTLIQVGTDYEYLDDRGTTRVFDQNGRFLSMTTREGFSQTMTYAGDDLTSVSDDFGNTIAFTVDVDGRFTSMTTPEGEIYTYTYTMEGLLETVVFPDDSPSDLTNNPTLTYLYESVNLPTGITGVIDENGVRFATYDYNEEGLAILSEHAGGADRFSISYDVDSTTVTNALGLETTYHYEVILGLRRITQIDVHATGDVAAASSYRTYDDHGYVASRTDNRGHVTDYTYTHTGNDPANADYFVGLETSRTEAMGTPAERTVTTIWNTTHRLPDQITEEGKTTYFSYDAQGRLTQRTEQDTTTHTLPYSTNGNTRTWTYTYNSAGLMATMDGPRTDVTDVTTYTYSASGDLSTVTNALGHVTTIVARDANGLPTETEDENGVTTTLVYDEERRLRERTIESAGGDVTTTFDYDDADQLVGMTLPNGATLAYGYDDARRLVAIENHLGERMEYTLDGEGNRTVEVTKDAHGTIVRTQQRVFDELSRLIQDLGANGQYTSMGYDVGNNLTGTSDALGNPMAQAFDALNRLIEMTDALSGESTYEYDDRGNLTQVIDPRGIMTTYVYDGLNNLIALASGDTGLTIYTYDAAGNQIGETRANGDQEVRTYDALNRLLTETFPADVSENLTYGYDEGVNGIGRLTSIVDATGTTTYSYDDRGNVTGVTANVFGQLYVTNYTYDLIDAVTSITYPSGRVVTYVRDTLGRVSSVTTQQDAASSVEVVADNLAYTAFGPLISWTHGNGLQTNVSYDSDYRLDTLVVGDGTSVLNRTHLYDLANNLTQIDDTVTGLQTYDYDELYRLIEGDTPVGEFDYTYDAVGNRLTESSTVDQVVDTVTYDYDLDSNQIMSTDSSVSGITSFAHNANGQIDTRTSPSEGVGYQYDVNNRLDALMVEGNLVAEYDHNALGQRVQKTLAADGSTQHFHYDTAGQLIAETTSSGDPIREYIYLENQLVGVIATAEVTEPENTTITLDSEDLSTEVIGQWNTSTAVTGYYGQNYLVHAANGPLTGGVVIDNGDPGFTTTGVWPQSTAISGYEGLDYQHHFANGVSPEGIELDNLDGATTGTWNTSTSVSGYTQNNYSHSAAGSGENVITWQLPVAQSGVYEIYAHWTAHANRASNATFEVTAGGQTTSVVVDQRVNGGSYQLLGAFNLTAGDTISLSNDADGYVIADGILVLPPNAAPNTATWTFTAADTDEYQLAANWTAHPNRASNATYTITTSAGSQTVVMNQRQSGGEWNVLGVVNLAAGETVTVSLTDVADGYVIADAIQMISTTAPPNQVIWHTGHGQAGEYEVYARWSAHPNRASDATYKIQHESGESDVVVNQQVSGGSWNYLGNYILGPDSQIRLSDQANGYVIADAVQLVWVPPIETQALYYVHNDHLGTPQVVTDANRNVRWRAQYAPFGEAEIVVNDIEMPIRFPGQYFDEESGLHYNYFRDYDPSLGRYVQTDPIGLAGGMNTFGYGYQNPARYVDIFGLEVTLTCRPLSGLGLLSFRHCATFIWHWSEDPCSATREPVIDYQFSLTSPESRFLPQGSNNSTYQADREAFEAGRENYHIAVPDGLTQDQFDAMVESMGKNYEQAPYSNARGGPNSNTAAENIIEQAGGIVPDVPGAWGQNYGE